MLFTQKGNEQVAIIEKMNVDELTQVLGEDLLMMTQELHMVKEKHWLVLVKSNKTYKGSTLSEALKKAVKEHFGIIEYLERANY